MIEISKSHKEIFISIKNFIKENLSLFILVPTILGGLLQIIQIFLISPALLRFFSLSQLVIDGLFVIIYFATVIFLPYYFAKRTMRFSKKISRDQRNFLMIIFYILVVFCIIINLVYQEDFKVNPLSDFLFEIFTFYIYGCGFFIDFPETNMSEELKFRIQGINLKMIILLVSYGIIFSFFAFIQISNTTPIDNFVVLEKKFEKDGEVKLLYFNDKYVFLQIDSKDSSKTKIHIEKLDSIF
jgi:hypothetical protein